MATIRMSKERKNELKIMKAVNGRDYIIREICAAFNEAHKDVKHDPDSVQDFSYGGYTIGAADGLYASNISDGVFSNLYRKYVYTEVKSESTHYKIGQQYTTSRADNPVISLTPEELEAGEPVRYKYECKDYVVDGLKGYFVKILTELTTMEKFSHSVSHLTLIHI